MKLVTLAATVAVLSAARAAGAADELPAPTRVESVALFKNGLAVVRRAVELKGPGTYRLDDAPEPVHGTFWVEGAKQPIDARLVTRDVDVPLAGRMADGAADLQVQLAGRQVTLHLKDEKAAPLTAKVAAPPRAPERWDRTYRQPEAYYGDYGVRPPPPAPAYLVLQTPGGLEMVDPATIARIHVEGADGFKQRRAVLLLDVKDEKPGHLVVSYLSKGLSWAPAYRLDLTDEHAMTLEQQAAVRNEMDDLVDARFSLISGFPAVRFAHVTTPMSPEQTWANFFAQLRQRIGPEDQSAAMSQQQVVSNSAMRGSGPAELDLAAPAEGEGTDLHFQDVGVRTLMTGESMTLSVAKASGQYERIVEWTVPDDRDAYGRSTERRRADDDPSAGAAAPPEAWDAVSFRNPLPFPMTTGPVMVTERGRLAGQQMTYWVNRGESTTVRVNRALSVRTSSTEQEDRDEDRKVVRIEGRDYAKVRVTGELAVANRRKQDVKVLIRREFSGDLTKADPDPETSRLREEGVYSVNRRNELTWTLTVPSGDERRIKYDYTVLVIH